MLTLFPLDNYFPDGFSYTEDFLTKEEEEKILKLENIPLNNMDFKGYTAKRKVATFGYDWNFEQRKLSKGKILPDEFNWLLEKVAYHTGIRTDLIAELLITEYPAGAVINWHRDAPPFGIIIGISLLSDCIFKLRPYDVSKQSRKNVITTVVKQRSLYIIKDAARSDWEHSISPVKTTRFSVTLRTLNN